MITVYKKENNATVQLDTDLIPKDYNFTDHWIHLSNPTDKEIEYISNSTSIPEECFKAALDEEERARIEREDGIVTSVTDIPFTEDDDEKFSYSTVPFGCIYNDNVIVTVCLKETSVVHELFMGRYVKDFNIHKRTRFFLQLQYIIAKKYLQYLKQIDKASQRVQAKLEISMKNEELIEMLSLEKSLVYFSTSLRANTAVLDKVQKLLKLYDEDEDLWDDVLIENRQAIEMSNIYREILSGTMDAYASIISNNLNVVMKVLASVTLLIAVPSMIAAFWGMNTDVPGKDTMWGFWVVIGVSVVITIILIIVLAKKKMLK